ncbi:MAG: TOBE domain-containing protein [Candidatus Omnitrophica bacterium]|nr:TOBE domain-containing protein [Candidatus Omnitrophota bacterium]
MNKIKGKIVNIESSDNLSIIQVNVDGDVFSSIVLEGKKTPLNYKIKDAVTLLFKETEVGLAKNLNGMISLRNRFPGTVKKIDKGPILAKVTLNYKKQSIESIISTQSALHMKLEIKDEVEWLVKTNEVTLMKNPA